VFERNLYQMPQRVPLLNGILDLRMGTTDKKGAMCTTCKGTPRTRNPESGTQNLERGIHNLEPGTQNLERGICSPRTRNPKPGT